MVHNKKQNLQLKNKLIKNKIFFLKSLWQILQQKPVLMDLTWCLSGLDYIPFLAFLGGHLV